MCISLSIASRLQNVRKIVRYYHFVLNFNTVYMYTTLVIRVVYVLPWLIM